MEPQKQQLILCILDGFGHSENQNHNAVFHAKTPTLDSILEKYPHTFLRASGLEVGLPKGQMGNSEVGHVAIGLGRIVFQDLPRISMAVKDNTLADIKELKTLIDTLKKNRKRCHLWGLLSDGGIHSHIDHIFGIANILLQNDIETFLHVCTDGRDTSPKNALQYIEKVKTSFGDRLQIATVGGRYYHMDRDKRWDRVEKAYNSMARPVDFWNSVEKYIEHCYAADMSDEFIPPVAIEGYDGIQDGDALISFNFRADRVLEMLSALTDDSFSGFVRPYGMPKFSEIVGVTEYSSELRGKIGVMFKKEESENSLGEVLSKSGLRQLRIAETEKYPHVTFFFNGGLEDPFDNEVRIMFDSPKIDTYDLEPEMSAGKITGALLQELAKKSFDVCIVNFANPDMVGHTGNFDAVVRAIEFVDSCVAKIQDAVVEAGGCLIITADHGNAEIMYNEASMQAHTAHTTNDVLFVIADESRKNEVLAESGGLKDVAPTILDILGLDKPAKMTGNTLRK